MKNCLKNILFVSLFFTFLIRTIPYKIILYDNDGVLGKRSSLGLLREIGLSYPLFHLFYNLKNPDIRKQCFDVLDRIQGPQIAPEGEPLSINNGLVVPQILCNWMKGTIHPYDLPEIVEKHIQKLDESNYFINNLERDYINNLLQATLNPNTLAKHTHLIPAAAALVKDIGAQKDLEGKSLFIQGILSNTANAPFFKTYDMKYNEALAPYLNQNYFFTSDSLQDLKPYSAIYKKVISRLKNDKVITTPNQIIFIDDEEINVTSAQQCGITALHLKDGNFNKLREELQSLTILPLYSPSQSFEWCT